MLSLPTDIEKKYPAIKHVPTASRNAVSLEEESIRKKKHKLPKGQYKMLTKPSKRPGEKKTKDYKVLSVPLRMDGEETWEVTPCFL